MYSVYPKAILKGSEWVLIIKVSDNRFLHLIPAGVTSSVLLPLLKVVFDLIVRDVDTPQDVDDALFTDDIRSGPRIETVWGNWQARAEAIIDRLAPDYTPQDFQSAWRHQDTAKSRQSIRRSLIIQRGWQIIAVHQHEGDGTNTDEAA